MGTIIGIVLPFSQYIGIVLQFSQCIDIMLQFSQNISIVLQFFHYISIVLQFSQYIDIVFQFSQYIDIVLQFSHDICIISIMRQFSRYTYYIDVVVKIRRKYSTREATEARWYCPRIKLSANFPATLQLFYSQKLTTLSRVSCSSFASSNALF